LFVNILASSCRRLLSRQVEGYGHFLHLRVAHALGLEAHALGIDIDLGRFREYVNLVKGIHRVLAQELTVMAHGDELDGVRMDVGTELRVSDSA